MRRIKDPVLKVLLSTYEYESMGNNKLEWTLT